MDDIYPSLNYSYWSFNYELGIEKSIALLELNHQKLLDLQSKFLKVLQKKVVLGAYNSALDLNSDDLDYTSGGKLQELFNNLVDSIQDLNDSKLLASTLIESDVILPLSTLTSSYKSYIDYLKDSLKSGLSDFDAKAKDLKKLEEQMINTLNHSKSKGESAVRGTHSKSVSDHVMESFTSKLSTLNASLSQVKISPASLLVKDLVGSQSINEDNDSEERPQGPESPSPIDFPLVLGDAILTFETAEGFAQFASTMFSSIPKSVTKIPLTNYRMEYIRLKDLTTWLIENIIPGRSRNLGSSNNNKENTNSRVLSRSQIEKIGQALIDKKLLSISNLAKKFSKFKSDDDSLWFEYTDLFKFIKDYDGKKILEENTSMNEITETSSVKLKNENKTTSQSNSNKRISSDSAFRSLTSYFPGNADSADLLLNMDIQFKKFEVAYEKYLDARMDLETKIMRVNKEIERKEYERIRFMYNLIERLSGILASQLLKELETIGNFRDLFASENNSSNYSADLRLLIEANGANSTYSVNPYYNASSAKLQILKGQEAPLFGSEMESQLVTSGTTSEPYFISEVLKLFPTSISWDTTFDFLSASQLKKHYLELSKQYLHQKDAIDKFLADLKEAEGFELQMLNFFKLFLLELPESVIPSFIYDEIVNLDQADDEDRQKQLLKLLENNLSRNSLSAIILIFEHISQIPIQQRTSLNTSKVPGSIPFIHLILRRSYSGGLKKDTFIQIDFQFYDRLTSDLVTILEKLPDVLQQKEDQFIKRKSIIKQNRLSTQFLDLSKTNELSANDVARNSTGSSPVAVKSPHTRHSSFDGREGRSSLIPFTIRDRASSSSRSPVRRDINFRPVAVTASQLDVDVLGNISVGKRSSGSVNTADLSNLQLDREVVDVDDELDMIEINVTESSP